MLPNFIIVGAEKAGTTSLWSMLSAHPDIFMCQPKEPKFFSHHWDKGIGWYESLFAEADMQSAIGEASPSYTLHTANSDWGNIPQRIQQSLGDIKYIYIVRHPVDRLLSHYRQARFHHWISGETTFDQALVALPRLQDGSRYFYQLERYLPYTSPDQWHILSLEELQQNAGKTSEGLCRFLDVEPMPLNQLEAKNVSDERVRLSKPLMTLKSIRPYLPDVLAKAGKRLAAKVGKKDERVNISNARRATLTHEFAKDVARLSEFCGKDFTAMWDIR